MEGGLYGKFVFPWAGNGEPCKVSEQRKDNKVMGGLLLWDTQSCPCPAVRPSSLQGRAGVGPRVALTMLRGLGSGSACGFKNQVKLTLTGLRSWRESQTGLGSPLSFSAHQLWDFGAPW